MTYKRLRNKEAAEEVVQEVFLYLWEKRYTTAIVSLQPYLVAMAKYGVFHAFSKQKKVEKALQQLSEKDVSDQELTPEKLYDDKQLLQIIDHSVNELPEKCRLVFKYSKQQDYSIQQISETMNISPKTVEAHLTKALKFIRLKFRRQFLLPFFIF